MIFMIQGKPMGKQRPRLSKYGHAYTPTKTRIYEELVGESYRGYGGTKYEKGIPIKINIKAYYPIAASDSKKVKEDKISGRIYPLVKPDIDNVQKAILDGLNKIAYEDDAQVIEVQTTKAYALEPKVIVELSPVGVEEKIKEVKEEEYELF